MARKKFNFIRPGIVTAVILCTHLMTVSINSSASSDIFMLDAENKQTYPIDTEELEVGQGEEVEERILKLLGLPDTPRPSYKHLKENAAPQFMMHLYQKIQKEEGLDELMPTQAPSAEEIGPEFRNLTYSVNQKEKINGVDIVISFVNQRKFQSCLFSCYRTVSKHSVYYQSFVITFTKQLK